jgi:hypothetical protein
MNTAVSTTDETVLPQLCQDEFPDDDGDLQTQAAERRDAQRDRLRMSIDQIAAEVTTALCDESLSMQVFFAVPSSGSALLTFATPNDPTDKTWGHASKIICGIVGNKIGVSGLFGRLLTPAATGVSSSLAQRVPHRANHAHDPGGGSDRGGDHWPLRPKPARQSAGNEEGARAATLIASASVEGGATDQPEADGAWRRTRLATSRVLPQPWRDASRLAI